MTRPGHRPQRVGEQIREELSAMLTSELRDPRIGFVTVTSVEVTPDLRHARVRVSVYGEEASKRESLNGLEHARGFLRRQLAQRMDLRRMPELHFELDQSAEYAERVESLLREVLPRKEESDEE